MNSIELHRKILGKDLLVSMVKTDEGIQIIAAGGERPHIGAVTIIDPTGKDTTVCFLGHKEDVVARKWARKIYDTLNEPVVVSVGIHFDNASKEMIAEILVETDAILDEACNIILDMA